MNIIWNALARQRFKTERTEFKSGIKLPHSKSLLPPILVALCVSTTSFADDLSQLYEKAYFLETAKGQTQDALEIYSEIVATEATDENRQILILSLERMLASHKKKRDQTLQDKVDHFTIQLDTLQRVVDAFGEPNAYISGNTVLNRETLTKTSYTMSYPNGFSIKISAGSIFELGFVEPNFSAKGIHVGSSLDEVVAAFPPDRTEDRLYNIPHVEKGVLYTNMSKGPEGTHSYPTTQGVRFFFIKNKVSGLYLNKDFRPGE